MGDQDVDIIEKQLLDSAQVKQKIVECCLEEIQKAAQILSNSIEDNRKVFLCGNGGSAADSQHLAAELVVKLNLEREAIPAIALTTDSSIITAESNDVGFGTIFRRQLEALANPGDVLIGISTSGNSQNVLNAIEYCNQNDVITIGLTGGDGGTLEDIASHSIVVPSQNVQRIQEGHITIGHILCDLVEKEIVKNC